MTIAERIVARLNTRESFGIPKRSGRGWCRWAGRTDPVHNEWEKEEKKKKSKVPRNYSEHRHHSTRLPLKIELDSKWKV